MKIFSPIFKPFILIRPLKCPQHCQQTVFNDTWSLIINKRHITAVLAWCLSSALQYDVIMCSFLSPLLNCFTCQFAYQWQNYWISPRNITSKVWGRCRHHHHIPLKCTWEWHFKVNRACTLEGLEEATRVLIMALEILFAAVVVEFKLRGFFLSFPFRNQNVIKSRWSQVDVTQAWV